MTAEVSHMGTADRATLAAFESERRLLLRQSRRTTLIGLMIASIILALSVELSDVTKSSVDGGLLSRIDQFLDRLFPDLRADSLFEDRSVPGSLASWFYDMPLWLAATWQTIEMALFGTVIGGIMALTLAFGAAANVNRRLILRQILRRGFDMMRTIPDIILALIFAAAFSLGAVAGVFTLIIITCGSLGKLFSECIENADMRHVEAVRATGGGWLLQMRYGIIPQLMPQIISYWLLRLEINLSVAAALGVVGAGGIGVELQRAISFTEFDTYLAILLMIVFCIFLIDMVSERIRHHLIGLVGGE
jgi:phosphonate transport system permease protein